MNLYAIRHGETNMGKNKVIATEEEPLNHNGKQQAIKLGKELNQLDIDLIFCSPIERAKHTLALFDLDKNIPIIIENRLKERDVGIYEKVPFANLDWEKFWGYGSDLKYPEAESMKHVYQRVANFIDELKVKEADKNILFVTHRWHHASYLLVF